MTITKPSNSSSFFASRRFKDFTASFLSTGVAAIILFVFLSPFLYMVSTAFKTEGQMRLAGAPIWPAMPDTLSYEGQTLDIYKVPMPEGGTRNLALFKKGKDASTFLDPKNPSAEPIAWQGSWRSLGRSWHFAATTANFTNAWSLINFPRLLFNTTAYAAITLLGILVSCIPVAFGFSRFRFPGRDFLFMILLSTIFLPAMVTVIPTYAFFVKIKWVGTYLPLVVPQFFANAYDTFLLRQYFMTLPRELDEAAMIDGASPFRVLWSVILPQSWPAVVAVSVFHIVWAWNDYFGPLIYLTGHKELQPISVAIGEFNGIWGSRPTLIQASALMSLIIPMILFFLAQRFFIQGIVITGVEK